MTSENGFRQWLGVVNQQAIIWANVDSELGQHLAMLGHNELNLAE